MSVFILVRWEGDHHEILGVYSTMVKAEGASLENIASMNKVPKLTNWTLIEYNVFEVQLDDGPSLGEYSGLKYTRKFHLQRKTSEFATRVRNPNAV